MKDLLVDAVGIAGAALIAYGAWMVYRPAGVIVAGVFLLLFAYLIGRTSA